MRFAPSIGLIRAALAGAIIGALVVQIVVLNRPPGEVLTTLAGGVVFWFFPQDSSK